MNISEETFFSWSKGPGTTQAEKCANAEKTVKKAIEASDELNVLDISVFAQGSYMARTNVRQDSDVDICVCCKEAFFADYPKGKTREEFGNVKSDFSYAEFKNMVGRALVDYFEDGVTRGNKAFDVHANTYRIDADVVPTLERRLYTGRKNTDGSDHFLCGVAFVPDEGARINNWPKQNYDSGNAKNGDCSRHYKRVVRIIKRLRYKMEDEGVRAASGIGSFLIESLVWNVPNEAFLHDTYTADVRYVLAHAFNNTRKDEDCPDWREVNRIKYLFHAAQPWTREQVHTFLSAAWDYVGFE